MAKQSKFTYKTTKPTGRYGSFWDSHHDIKLNKIKVGMISDKEWDIRLMVIKKDINEDNCPNCEWKWIQLGKKSDSLAEAKEFLDKNFDSINDKYNLRKSE